MAEASLFVLELDKQRYEAETDPMLSHINVGTGHDVSILEVAKIIAQVTGFKGKITCDTSKPDGTMRKLMDVSRLERMGWNAQIELREGLERTYAWYKDQLASGAVLRTR
jgi:nucleoside-diphosphate-sugar epimerase